IASAAVGWMHNGTAVPMALAITVCAGLAACLAWYTGQIATSQRNQEAASS
ncbi:MAG TPA: Bcr/CflA family drug resistance efflux transporter, partial [Pseudomonas sp.]|nr:Bcr/CflA family drug resistance efflux transporter [Pseudomonas sp.]